MCERDGDAQVVVERVTATVQQWREDRCVQLHATARWLSESGGDGAVRCASHLCQLVGDVSQRDGTLRGVTGTVRVVGGMMCVSCTTGEGIGARVKQLVQVITGASTIHEAVMLSKGAGTGVCASACEGTGASTGSGTGTGAGTGAGAGVSSGAGAGTAASSGAGASASVSDRGALSSATQSPSALFPWLGQLVPNTYAAIIAAITTALAPSEYSWFMRVTSTMVAICSTPTSVKVSSTAQRLRTRVVPLAEFEACMNGVIGAVSHDTFLEALSFAHQAGVLFHDGDSTSPIHSFVVTDLGWLVDAIKRVACDDLLVGQKRQCNRPWCHTCERSFSVSNQARDCDRCGRTFCSKHCIKVTQTHRGHDHALHRCRGCSAVLQHRARATIAATTGFARGMHAFAKRYTDRDVAKDLAAMREPERPVVHERLLCLELWSEFQPESLPVLLHLLTASGLLLCEPHARDALRVEEWEFDPEREYVVPCLMPCAAPVPSGSDDATPEQRREQQP